MFALHEGRARGWLADLIVAYELRTFDGRDSMLAVTTAPIAMDWRCGTVGEEDTVVLLVRAAQTAGVITGPPGMSLTAEFVDDGDQGYYRFFLHALVPAPLTVASSPHEACQLADLEATGIEAAVMVLRSAARAAQVLHDQLAGFVAAGSTPDREGDSRRP
ncbi:hypothetical protein [Streptomyces millisiae]|uniref:Uncharacterized protein n=1 Tax=Streptomyces millisiae TaxID=3075542 RepID=A0ABU2LLS4_9ACTN|nr:hypothetical protein [Streptomyces sp. DSM 44918]MDT0318539.1 hypothetical protein [Streptomyces sp. DSM 44918]